MLRYLFCILLVPASVAAAPAHAQVLGSDNTEAVTMSTRGVDLRDPAQARAFYARMETVAHQVCDTAPDASPWVVAENADCRERALDEAVRYLNRDALTAVRQADVTAKAANPALRARR